MAGNDSAHGGSSRKTRANLGVAGQQDGRVGETHRLPPRVPSSRYAGVWKGLFNERLGRKDMSGRLIGKRIIVTGAGANIGREAVRSFVAEGARVVIGGRDGEAGRRVEEESGSAVAYRFVDVTSEDSVQSFTASACGVAERAGCPGAELGRAVFRSGHRVRRRQMGYHIRGQTRAAISSAPNMRCRICGNPAKDRLSTCRRLPAVAVGRA